ncbi:hypothetical protein [Gordonia westfalica]|uniref:Uncharacterized protein n=1 Tax=Gordonia westfalica TaxID=158898 RepID=A0A1H2JTQ3_9ACTN|nr:hypothetical protein [Gordonia westfalica]SDU59536.1 hypothetical protein SAMN04488548_1342475 [Gordonia westfalica]
MSITQEFDDAYHAGVARLRRLADERATRLRDAATERAAAARLVVAAAKPVFAAAFARLQSEGFAASRLPTNNKGFFRKFTEPVISTIDNTDSWEFGPFAAFGNYITARGDFFLSPDVRCDKAGDDKEVVPVFNALLPPKYAQYDGNVRGMERWYNLEDAVEAQARAIAAAVVPSLNRASDRQLSNRIVVDESTGEVLFLWTEYEMKLRVAEVTRAERMELFRPGVPFQGRYIESLENYVERLVTRKIMLSGNRSRR